jgi:phosphocarrier protein FPr
MIGLVIVSHSAKLAEGLCELAAQMGRNKVRTEPAGGTADPASPIGTDAFRVLEAIESVYSDDGVLILMDLGSAVLSAETALELLDEDKRSHVHLYPGPVVEQAVAAASLAAAGAGIEEILGTRTGAERPVADARGSVPEPAHRAGSVSARSAPEASEHRAASVSDRSLPPTETAEVIVQDPLGLHARPAAKLVRLSRGYQATVAIRNLTANTGPADAAGIHALLSLNARHGHRLRIEARGPEAAQAVAELARALAEDQPAGLPASAGIAIGPLVKLHFAAPQIDPHTVDDPVAEENRLQSAIRKAQDETRALYDWANLHAGAAEAAIFDAQSLMLEDPDLLTRAASLIRDGHRNAAFAIRTAANELAGRVSVRAADLADVGARVLRILTHAGTEAPHLAQPSILAAHDLAPSDVQALDPHLTLGLCLESSSASVHSVILARAMGIPAVVGVGPVFSSTEDGATVAIDGERGAVWISPSPDELAALETRRREWLAARQEALAHRGHPAATRDGRRIRVFANLAGVSESAAALDYGAEGVGVLRTEFLFLNRAAPPDEEEQFAAYRAIAESLGERPLVIRTLDIGGDKSAPYVGIGEEQNPFLGWRGIRISLDRGDLLRTQLRAILRAAPGHRIEILLPMISALDELRRVRAILADLGGGLPVGVMIEVPSAVAIADQLAAEAAFFSVGTNDLVQYLMAADRTNARVASLADPFQPAVLRALQQVIQAGRRAGIPVTLCGEFAADTLATPLLLGLGLEEFSLSAPLIPDLKRAIGRCTMPECERVAARALTLDSHRAVREFLASL